MLFWCNHINYKYISNDKGTINEIDSESSLLKPCIHPQRILHGDASYDKYNELGTEISFPRSSNYTNYFIATESYIINISELDQKTFTIDPKNPNREDESIVPIPRVILDVLNTLEHERTALLKNLNEVIKWELFLRQLMKYAKWSMAPA